LDPPASRSTLGLGNWLISESQDGSPDRPWQTRSISVAATVDALAQKNAIFGEDPSMTAVRRRAGSFSPKTS
jgi:hypothetical protein